MIGHDGANGMFFLKSWSQRKGWASQIAALSSVCRRINTHRIRYSSLKSPRRLTPNVRWHADIMEMEESVHGNKYVLVMMDEFRRFLWLRVSEKKLSSTVLERELSYT